MKKKVIFDRLARKEFEGFDQLVREDFDAYAYLLEAHGRLIFPDARKISEAIKSGDLIPYEKIWNSYSQSKKDRILQKARYIKAAMELRKLRKTLSLSQNQLAKRMSVKREFISRIESGKQNVTLDMLYRVAEVTGKDLKLVFR